MTPAVTSSMTPAGLPESVPGYWMDETSGRLRQAVAAYLHGSEMTPQHLAYMRAYLRLWASGDWRGEGIEALRAGCDRLTSREAIDDWLELALDLGIDPL